LSSKHLDGGALVDEALRINLRYLVEIVERFELCPWARGAREDGAVARRVLLGGDRGALVDGIVAAHDEWAAAPRTLIGLVILPDLHPDEPAGIDADTFEALVNDARRAITRRAGGRPPFALAPFHPTAAYRTERPEQLVPLLRRAPDPTIQLVRFSALDAVKQHSGKFLFDGSAAAFAELERRATQVPISDRIARDNFATVGRVGIEALLAILDAIAADRRRAYRAARENSSQST
jgi:hypothetical protein